VARTSADPRSPSCATRLLLAMHSPFVIDNSYGISMVRSGATVKVQEPVELLASRNL
jgi:hypothetical protein